MSSECQIDDLAEEPQEQSPRREKILIVEDEVDIADNLRQILALKGYETAVAHDPDAAAKRVQEGVDLVLMDINLSGQIDGIETALRLNSTYGPIHVVFVTAYCDDATLERAKQVEPLAYLVKPFRSANVLTTVEISLANARARAENRQKALRLETAQALMPDALVFVDVGGKVSSLNPPAERLVGISSDEVIGMELQSLLRLVEPDDQDACGALVERILAAAVPSGGRESTALASKSGELEVSWSSTDEGDQPEAAILIRRIGDALRKTTQAGDVPRPKSELDGPPPPESPPFLESQTLSAVMVILDHIDCLRGRFGNSAIDQISFAYEQHLAQAIPSEWIFHRWEKRRLCRGSSQRISAELQSHGQNARRNPDGLLPANREPVSAPSGQRNGRGSSGWRRRQTR